MPYLQVKDVLARIRQLHERLRDWSRQQPSESPDPRVDALLRLISSHADMLQAELAKTGAETSQDLVLETWLQYETSSNAHDLLEEIVRSELRPSTDVDDVIARVFAVDQALVDAYGKAATSNLAPPRARAFFADLEQMQRQHGKQYSKAVLDLET